MPQTQIAPSHAEGRPHVRRSEQLARRRRDDELFVRCRRDGDPSARAELVERFLPLARRLARRYERANEPLEALVQVASLALLKAIDHFDLERGDALSSYAVPTILGELRRYFRDTSWALHVPRGMQERVLEVHDAVDRLSRDLGRSPSPQQLALLLDAPRGAGDDDPASIVDTMGETDPCFELVEEPVSVRRGLRALPERERKILYLRFAEGLTQAQIAERLGISQMHVSRLIRRSFELIRLVVDDG
jgi:RNA polymerase sigma-B factor